jgi:hypothetical protein
VSHAAVLSLPKEGGHENQAVQQEMPFGSGDHLKLSGPIRTNYWFHRQERLDT